MISPPRLLRSVVPPPEKQLERIRRKIPASELAERVINGELSAKREAGESLRAIAADADVSHMTVKRRCNAKSVRTQKALQPRKVTKYTVTHYTKPETAAAKIRALGNTSCPATRTAGT